MSKIVFISVAATATALCAFLLLSVMLQLRGRLSRGAVLGAWLIFAAFVVVVWVAAILLVLKLGGVWALVAAPFVLFWLTAVLLGFVIFRWKDSRVEPTPGTIHPEPEAQSARAGPSGG